MLHQLFQPEAQTFNFICILQKSTFVEDCPDIGNQSSRRHSMALAAQLTFLTKLKKGQLRNFDEDKGCMSASVHLAIMDNNYHRLRLLIDAGMSINVRNHHNLTPLHLACSKGGADMVRLLVKYQHNKTK